MINSTRSVVGAYYRPGAPLRLISVPVMHFNFDDGFDQPLLGNILRGSTHVKRRTLELCSCEAKFLVFVASKPVLDRETRLMRRQRGVPVWDGDMVIMRRALNKQGFVNFRKGDRGRACAIATHVLRSLAMEDRHRYTARVIASFRGTV